MFLQSWGILGPVDVVGGAVLNADGMTRVDVYPCARPGLDGGTTIVAVFGGLGDCNSTYVLQLATEKALGCLAVTFGGESVGERIGTRVDSIAISQGAQMGQAKFECESRYGLEVAPNPSRGSVSFAIRGEKVAASSDAVAIYSVRGEMVARRQLDDGAARILWDGRDRRGARVASGVYLARYMREGAVVAEARVVLVR